MPAQTIKTQDWNHSLSLSNSLVFSYTDNFYSAKLKLLAVCLHNVFGKHRRNKCLGSVSTGRFTVLFKDLFWAQQPIAQAICFLEQASVFSHVL